MYFTEQISPLINFIIEGNRFLGINSAVTLTSGAWDPS